MQAAEVRAPDCEPVLPTSRRHTTRPGHAAQDEIDERAASRKNTRLDQLLVP
jgi:hypothetical protein